MLFITIFAACGLLTLNMTVTTIAMFITLMNEVPVLFLVGIVILAVVKPF